MNTRSRHIGWIIVGILIGIVVTQTVVATLRTDDSVRIIKQVQRDSLKTLQTVEACTKPGRPCYERSQRQMARAVASINRITILAAACAAGDERTAGEIEECVLRRLTRD